MAYRKSTELIRITTHYYAERRKIGEREIRTDIYYHPNGKNQPGNRHITVWSLRSWLNRTWSNVEIGGRIPNGTTGANKADEFARAVRWAAKEARKLGVHIEGLNRKVLLAESEAQQGEASR